MRMASPSAKETKDASKRRKLEAMSAEMSEPLAGEPGAVASGADPLASPWQGNRGRLPLALIPRTSPKMLRCFQPADSQKSWHMVEAVETSKLLRYGSHCTGLHLD